MRIPPAALSLGIAPALLALPVITVAAPEAVPVAPSVESISLAASDIASTKAVVDGDRAVRTTRGGGTDDRLEVTLADPTTDPFQLVGVSWPAGASVEGMSVEVRVREDDSWTDWQDLEPMDEAPDPGTAEARSPQLRGGTAPLITEAGEGVELRIRSAADELPADLRLDLIDPGTSPADGNLDRAQPAATAQAAGQPTVYSRAFWGADESLRSGEPSYNDTIKAGVIHHTATSNAYYSAAEAMRHIRSFYAYHTQSLGWSDIGYNFLVDKWGNIYEGRYGGIDRAVKGAHTGGFNVDTFGVAAIGNLDVADPPAQMLESLSDVIAWKAQLHDLDPFGKTRLTSEGGGTARFPAGTTIEANVIAGHRDFGNTTCPGDNLYSELAKIRTMVSDRVTPQRPPDVAILDPSLSAASADYEGDGTTVRATVPAWQRWKLEVFSPCLSTPIGVVEGHDSTTIAASWNGRTGSGNPAPPDRYTLILTSWNDNGTATWRGTFDIRETAGSPPQGCPVRRISGSDRFETSVEVGRAAFPGSRTVVIVSGDEGRRADGAVAAPFAYLKKAPVLLSTQKGLSTAVIDDIKDRGATRAYVVGGTVALSGNVDKQLRAAGVTTITRFAGDTRYETSAMVARAMGHQPWGAFVASGDERHLIDALAAGGIGARNAWPVLLTQKDRLPAVTLDTLERMGVQRAFAVGGPVPISDAVVASLPGGRRIAGDNLYETAEALATTFASSVGTDRVVLASGDRSNIIDTLGGGTFGNLILLTERGEALTPATEAWLADRDVRRVLVVGGPMAVSDGSLQGALQTLLR